MMKQLFLGSGIVRRFTFKTTDTRDSYALFAAANHLLAQLFANLWEKSAHLAFSMRKACFECLTPRKTTA